MSENSEWPVEIRRSKQRAKTISARVENGRLIILAPEKISDKELQPIIERLQKRLKKRLSLWGRIPPTGILSSAELLSRSTA